MTVSKERCPLWCTPCTSPAAAQNVSKQNNSLSPCILLSPLVSLQKACTKYHLYNAFPTRKLHQNGRNLTKVPAFLFSFSFLFFFLLVIQFISLLVHYILLVVKAIAHLKMHPSPGWCGSVDWAPACEQKGHQFDSQSGHMPGLQARSPVGGAREAPHADVSLPFSLPSPLSKNK